MVVFKTVRTTRTIHWWLENDTQPPKPKMTTNPEVDLGNHGEEVELSAGRPLTGQRSVGTATASSDSALCVENQIHPLTRGAEFDMEAFLPVPGDGRQRDARERNRPCRFGAGCKGISGNCINRHECKYSFEKCRSSGCNLIHFDRNGARRDKPPKAGESRPTQSGTNSPGNQNGGRPLGPSPNNPLPPNPPPNPPVANATTQVPAVSPMTYREAEELDMVNEPETVIKTANVTLKAGKEWKELTKQPEKDPFSDKHTMSRTHAKRMFWTCFNWSVWHLTKIFWANFGILLFVLNDPYNIFWREERKVCYCSMYGRQQTCISEHCDWVTPMVWYWKWLLWGWVLYCAYGTYNGVEQFFLGRKQDAEADRKEFYGIRPRPHLEFFWGWLSFSTEHWIAGTGTEDYSIRQGANVVSLPCNELGDTLCKSLEWLEYPDYMSSHFEFPVGLCRYLSSRVNQFHTATAQYSTIGAYIRNWCKENKCSGEDTAYYLVMAAAHLRPEGEVWPKISQV